MAIDHLWISIAATALGAWLLAGIVQAIISVYFGSISHVPGSKLAAATTWWRAYVEFVKHESWTDKLIELHSMYGNEILLPDYRYQCSMPLIESETDLHITRRRSCQNWPQ